MTQLMYLGQRYQKYYQRLEPIFKNRQTQALTMVTLSLMTIAFFGNFAVRPTLKTIATLHRQIEDKTFLNQKLEEKITALIAAQDTYQKLETNLEKIYSLMPAEVELPSLIRRLELVSVNNNALISNFQVDSVFLYNKTSLKVAEATASASPTTENSTPDAAETQTATSPAASAAKHMQVSFTLIYQGEYQNLANLINQLTQMDRLLNINSFSISKEKGVQAATLSLSLAANAYYLPL